MRLSDAELATYVRDHQNVTPVELTRLLGVSDRTVRTYVRRANDAMIPFAQIVLKRGCYSLTCADEAAFTEWLSRNRANTGSVAALPENSKERVAYIVDDLLSRSDWITKEDLAEMLFVSVGTISHDLSIAEQFINSYGLTIERRPRYGIKVTGGEMSRRLCIASVVSGGLLDDGMSEDKERQKLLERVSTCIDEVVRRDAFSVSTLAYRNLLVHVAVAILRIREGNYVPMSGDELEHMEATREYSVARDIALELEKSLSVTLPVEEIAYIAIHLASKQMIPKTEDENAPVVIDDDVWKVVSDMLDVVKTSFRYDFRDNLELRMNLARHIVPLSYRLTYNMNLKNPLLDEVRVRYPLAWSMAVESSVSLAHEYGRAPSDDEIGYIAMSFALALEREKTHAEGKRILIVCASGAGTAKLLEHLYEREFGQWLADVKTCDAAHVADIDLTDIDYVFTTVPVDLKIARPVRQVSAFLGEAEKRDVRAVLSSRIDSEKVIPYFDRTLFYPHVPCDTREEILDWLCERRIEHGGAGEGYRDLVFRREKAMQTTYGNNVAMPHPIEAVSDETIVTVGITDKPVPWGDSHEVQVIFLLSVSRDGGPGRDFYDALASLMVDEVSIARLVRERRWETLCALLDGAEK